MSREQVALLGLGRESLYRLLDRGQWKRLDRAIYFVLPTPPDWLAYAWAGVLLGGSMPDWAAPQRHGCTD